MTCMTKISFSFFFDLGAILQFVNINMASKK